MPGIPRDADGPVFREPWEAQAFAMTLALHERGLFTWTEWAAALAAEIKRAQAAGDPDTGETYYSHWLAALEKLVAEKGVTTDGDVASLSRRLGSRLRPHAARPADRIEGRGFFQLKLWYRHPEVRGAKRRASIERRPVSSWLSSFEGRFAATCRMTVDHTPISRSLTM